MAAENQDKDNKLEPELFAQGKELEAQAFGPRKKLNKLPLLIIGGLAGTVLLFVFGFGMAGRIKSEPTPQELQEEQEKTAQQSEVTSGVVRGDYRTGLGLTYGRSAGGVPDGVIPEQTAGMTESPEPPAPDPQPAPQPETQSAESSAPNLLSANPVPDADLPGQSEEDQLAKATAERRHAMLQRIEQMHIQSFEAALAAKTAVQIDATTAYADSGAQFDPNDPDSISAEQQRVREQIARVNAQLTALQGGDVAGSQVYNAQSAAVAGAESLNTGDLAYNSNDDGVSGTSGGEGYARFNRHGSWSLNDSLTAPLSRFIVRGGTVIPATLISGINSDLAGQIMAQVSQNVYDSATGKYLLIPQGTRLIGAYSTGDIVYGQERLMVAWQRLIYPDGKVLDLGAMPGADVSGYSGFKDQVDNHWWKLISSSFLMSGIVAMVAVAADDDDSSGDDDGTNVSDEMRQAMATQFGNVIAQVIQRNLNIAPTLQVRPGYRFNVMVTKDMTFAKEYEAFDY